MRFLMTGFAFILAICPLGAVETNLSDVVPASKAPARDAHFNWTFASTGEKPLRTGQFACGSYWVAPAAGEKTITFVSLTGNPKNTGDKKDLLFCDADPLVERHGFMTKNYGSRDESQNLIPKLPKTFTPPQGSCISLVAAMQRNETYPGAPKGGTKGILGGVIDAYCVVTLLPEPPKDNGKNMIRPNITGATREFLTWDDFDLTRLKTYDFIEPLSDEGVKRERRRWRNAIEIFGGLPTQMNTKKNGLKYRKFSEGGRGFRSHLLMHDYASGMAVVFNNAALSLLSSKMDIEEKKKYLASMLAFGLDIYHARYDYGENAPKMWSCGAGQSMGGFLPPVLVAALLKDPAKANVLRAVAAKDLVGETEQDKAPQELRQIRRGQTGVLLWGDGQPLLRKDNTAMTGQDWRYWADFVGSRCYDGYVGKMTPNANRGKKTAADPYGFIDGPANKPGSAYMGVTTGCFQSTAAMMILCPAVRSVVNTDKPIEYVDRLVRHGLWTWPDPVAIPIPAEQDTARTWYSVKGADHWGKTWGPNPKDLRFAVEDGKGRFKSLHGHKFKKFGYTSARSRNHWGDIIPLYKGDTYEKYAVDLKTAVMPEIVFVPAGRECKTARAYLWSPTFDATVRYTTDGGVPNEQSPVFDPKNPIEVTAGQTIKAVTLHKTKTASKTNAQTYQPPVMK